MAITIVNGNRGNFTHKTTGTTWAIGSPSGTLAAGNYGLLAIVIDNPGTQEAETADISVTDSNGNTWTRLVEWTDANTAAATGCSVALFLSSKLTEDLTTADTLEAQFNSQSVIAKGAGLAELSAGAGNILVKSTSGSNGANTDASASYSVALSGLTNVAGLYIGVAAAENEVDAAVTLDAAYAEIGFGAIGSGTAGLATSNVRAFVGTLANTSTGDTFNVASGLTSSDRATILVRLEEATGPASLAPTGIVSGETFGAADAVLIAKNVGAIAAAAALGEPQTHFLVRTAGIASGEAFGQPTLTPAGGSDRRARVSWAALCFPVQSAAPIYSIRAVGNIASAEAFGTPWIPRLAIAAIVSAEAFGQPRVIFVLRTGAGIASAEALGQPKTQRLLRPQGLSSAEAFGGPKIQRLLFPVGATSAEAFGLTTLLFGARFVQALGAIASAETWGTPAIVRILRASGIASEQAFADPRVIRVVRSDGIPSAETFSAPRVLRIVRAIGLTSGETFGTATIIGGVIVEFPSVYGGVLVSDVPRYEVVVADGETYLVLTEDIPLGSLFVSDNGSGDVSVSDAAAAGILIHDRPGG